MKKLQINAKFKIHPGKLDQFKAVARDCVARVKERDTGTFQYDWFFNQDQTECQVRERYADSNVLEHITNMGPLLPAVLAVADLSLEIFGEPSNELIQASQGLDPTVYDFFQGIES